MLPEVEVRLEHLGLERDGALVERLRLGDLVARVVDVGEIDQRRHEIRIDLERAPVGRGSPLEILRIPVVEDRGRGEVLVGRQIPRRAAASP